MYLLALLVGPFLLIVCLLVGGYVVYWAWQRRQRIVPSPEGGPVVIHAQADRAVGFGYKMAWIATPAPSAKAVAEAMQLRRAQPANWQSGMDAATVYPGNPIFVTPPIQGWVLAAGTALPLPDDSDDSDDEVTQTHWRALMIELSQQFGKAHFYATHRVSSYSAWAIYEQGVERRSFAWADDTLLNRGEPLPEEVARIGLLLNAEREGQDGGESIGWPDENAVLELAGAWSIDPTTLPALDLPPSVGLIGQLGVD